MTDGMREGAPGWQDATIDSISSFTASIKRVVLRPQSWRVFLPGQHIDLRLTAPDGYQARRSYSITSAPETAGTFEIAIERLPDGEVSPYFHEVAAVGDNLEISGPFAEHFVWRSEEPASVLLVGGGSGVAPLLSMVRHRAFVPNASPMTLLYSARTWDDVIVRDELITHDATQPDLRVMFCLTRDHARRAVDYSRRIDADILKTMLTSFSPQQTFVCGNNSFVGTVSDTLLELGVAAATIRTERYGGGEGSPFLERAL